jgi:hypothetical protein
MDLRPRGPALRLATTGCVLLAIALTAYATLRLTIGYRPASINVRWAPQVEPASRQQLERQYHLEQGQLADDRTYSYQLSDVSTANIRALIGDPAVEDTHRLHRTAFRVGLLTPRGPYPAFGRVLGPVIEAIVLLLGAIALGAFGLSVIHVAAPAAIRELTMPLTRPLVHPAEAVAGLRRAFEARIPEVSEEAASLFRIVFAAWLLGVFWSNPVSSDFLVNPPNELSRLQLAILSPFMSAPGAVSWVLPWLLVLCTLFMAGVATRLTFTLMTLGACAWAALVTTRVTYHTISALLLTLLCLTGAKWGEAWSVGGWVNRSRALPERARAAREFGYTVWMPGFVLGVTLAAAAFAKLRESGVAWITNGTIKYHFLADAGQAPLDWGLRVGAHPQLAVALSLGAIVVEALVIVGACSRDYRYRVLAGAGALALLAAIFLFQGLFWPAWWILLLSFLPWHRIGTPSSVPRAAMVVRWAPLIVVGLVIAQQAVVSGLRLEAGPLFSAYGMYSTSYASPEEFEQKSGESFWIVTRDARECPVTLPDADAVVHAQTRTEPTLAAGIVIERCFRTPMELEQVTVEKRQFAMDWNRWRPAGVRRTRLSPEVQ